MKRITFTLALTIWCLLLISGCQVNSNESASPALPTSSIFNSTVPTPLLSHPLPGRASIIGQISTQSGEPLVNIPVHIAKIYRQGDEGIFVLNSFSPAGLTDSRGYFAIENVEPGEYVIVVGNPEGEYEIISTSPGEAKIWSFLPDKVTDIGILKVSLRGH